MLQEVLSKVNVELLESLDYGDEIKLNDRYALYHYTEDEVVVLNLSTESDWDEIVQCMWDTDTGEVIFEIIENDLYHIEMGKPFKDTNHVNGTKYYDSIRAVQEIMKCLESDEEMSVIHPDFREYNNEELLEIGHKFYGITYIGDNNNKEVTPDYESMYKNLKSQVQNLLKAIDQNTTRLWSDDLECTHDCIMLDEIPEVNTVEELATIDQTWEEVHIHPDKIPMGNKFEGVEKLIEKLQKEVTLD